MKEKESINNSITAEVVVAGHICLDIIPTLASGTALLAPGRLIEAGPAIISTGGPVSNVGLALHKLGIATRLMGKIGTDLFGQAIRQLITSHEPELAEGMIVVPGETSSYSVIISLPGTDRMFIHAPGCNATFSADDVPYDDLATMRLFHFGYPPLMEHMYRSDRTELATIFQHIKAIGLTTSLDMSMPDPNSPAGQADWHVILRAALPYVDIFLPSLEELLFMLRRPLFDQLTAEAGHTAIIEHVSPTTVTDLATTLLGMGAKIVGLKAGHRGLYLRTSSATMLAHMGRVQPAAAAAWAERELWAPCFQAQVVGTTGSGDATIAGFLLGLLRGMTPEETLATACAVGACNVEAADALSGIRTWPETAARIAAGWPRLSLTLDSPGWRWDETHQVWVGPLDSR